MNFVVALTPTQYLMLIIGFILAVFAMVSIDKNTPDVEKYTFSTQNVVEQYIKVRDGTYNQGANNKQAVVSSDLRSLTITPNDWRLIGEGEFQIMNITSVDVSGARFSLVVKSPSLGTNTLKLVPIQNFPNPIKPNEVARFNLKFNDLAMTALRFEKSSPSTQVKDYVGTHLVSNVEVTVEDFIVSGTLPSYIAVAPKAVDLDALNQFKKNIDQCWAYFETLVNLRASNKPFQLSATNFESNRACLDKINVEGKSLAYLN